LGSHILYTFLRMTDSIRSKGITIIYYKFPFGNGPLSGPALTCFPLPRGLAIYRSSARLEVPNRATNCPSVDALPHFGPSPSPCFVQHRTAVLQLVQHREQLPDSLQVLVEMWTVLSVSYEIKRKLPERGFLIFGSTTC
jgi:hypothetical protein